MVNKLSLWLVLIAFVGSTAAFADVDKDKDKNKNKSSNIENLRSFKSRPDVGNCNLGSAAKDLDGNNIRARLYNNGALFWKGSGNVYTVPKNGEANSIFASGIWIGGLDSDGDLRFAGTAYGPFEYWPGPLDTNGNPPADCSVFDRIYKVTRTDLNAYNETGVATADLQDWPVELGAPVVDGDGVADNYNLAGGDRPELIGEQTAWWVMNDVGSVKEWSATEPIGLEVQVTAFAFNTADALNNTTFYKYKLIHKGDEPLIDTYFGIWSDPDLGNAADDFVGSDTTLGLGIVYNGQDNDQGFDGYGTNPPALAYDFFSGPLVPDTTAGAVWTDPDGTEYPGQRRIGMQKFVYYNNDSSVQGNPTGNSDDPYNYLRGIWRDNTPMTFGGTGYGGSQSTNFMFPGDASKKEFWSEENTDNAGSRNTPADRRFLLSTGPFTMNPGDVQDIVYGIVWSQSVNRLASFAQLKFDDVLAQGAFNSNFNIPRAPDAPVVTTEVFDKTILLDWGNSPTSNNFLNGYDAPSAFLVDQNPPDGNTTYTFEGYRVYQYDSPFDQVGRVIATFDVQNQVTTVVDDALDLASGAVVTQVVANGSDSGVKNFLALENLTNYQDYYLGVQAYAYNPNSLPKIYASPIVRLPALQPTKFDARRGGTASLSSAGDVVNSVRSQGTGDSFGVLANVADPAKITGDDYNVSTYNVAVPDSDTTTVDVLTYNLINATTGEVIINGEDFYNSTGKFPPFGSDLLTKDGLSFGVDTAPADFNSFLMIANGAGPITDGAGPRGTTGGAADFQGFPVPERPGSNQQVGDGIWFWATGDVGTGANYNDVFIPRSVRNGFGVVVPWDWEIRFTAECYDAWRTATDAGDPFATPANGCYGYDRFGIFGDSRPQLVPFELWNTGIATPEDPSDDYRAIPAVIDWEGDGFDLQFFDSSVSGSDNDPESDWFYWYDPCNAACDANDFSPGEDGYNRWQSDLLGGVSAFTHGRETLARTVVVNWNGGAISAATDKADYQANVLDQDMPEAGSILRAETTKPLADGDVFTISSGAFAPVTASDSTATASLDKIGIVPNPYKGASAYEVDLTSDKARFTNLPQTATIRVFSLAGTLVRTIEKNSSSATLEWDLTTQEGLPLASGMYLIHVEVPGVGEKVIKFGFIKKRIQLDLI
ncbi:MAG: T9SS type A sorting domain-containing protein [Rhodothermales bacterium]|nr:T9SS type A sorting domain-containing protein [Rhodothermales bacterium]